jgi:HD-GYP domain-containing protein (c-di-GMP phosphodiesterase class II)
VTCLKTGADAGSLYLVERATDNDDPSEDQLRFKLAQNDSVQVSFREKVLPLDDNSMAGYAARHAQTDNVHDVYRQPPHSRYQASRAFDDKSGYRTKSMLMVPMQDHKGQVIGVVQLINKKRSPSTLLQPVEMVEEEVIPFTSVDEQLAGSLASQAAVAFQNAALLKNIRELFEEFVNAAVKAVEKRDPVTSGHSERVAILTVGLAEKVDALSSGPLADVRLTRDQMKELRYASILHDFGKVAVPEKVLKKGKKLLASELKNVELRFAYRARVLEAAHLRRKMEAIDSERSDAAELAVLDAEYEKKRRELDQALEAIRLANEPRLVAERGIGALEASFSAVRKLEVRPFGSEEDEQALPVEEWMDGPLLSARERDALLIPRGSLTADERSNEDWGIESHVRHTYEFLQKIPWTGEFRRIPEIAWAHHEKLDGSGYPRKLKGPDQIPVQSRMMTVSDIFDALVAWDRPYKKAASPERALNILAGDVEKGKLDKDLLAVFVDSRIWEGADYLGLLASPPGKGKPGSP